MSKQMPEWPQEFMGLYRGIEKTPERVDSQTRDLAQELLALTYALYPPIFEFPQRPAPFESHGTRYFPFKPTESSDKVSKLQISRSPQGQFEWRRVVPYTGAAEYHWQSTDIVMSADGLRSTWDSKYEDEELGLVMGKGKSGAIDDREVARERTRGELSILTNALIEVEFILETRESRTA